MEILFIIMIFFIGTVFGSFFTLAVYRIPLGKNITHERSFCPNCEHRLEFKDLIPIFSYIFLKGKCRYCGQKVRPRYLILEILSGIVFVFAYISVKINILGISYLYFGINYEGTVEKLIYLLAFTCFYITNALIIGIDKEYRQINKKVLIFGILTQIIYMMYLYTLNKQNIHGIYLILLIIMVGVAVFGDPSKKQKYIFQNIIYLIYITTFIGIRNLIILMPILIAVIIYNKFFINRKNVGGDAHIEQKITNPIGFLIGISAIIIALISNFIKYYIQ